jgi:hypothetical protein
MRFPSPHDLKNRLESLIQTSFSQPPSLWSHTSDKTEQMTSRGRRAIWVLSRSVTRHQIVSVPATLPENKRRAAIELQVRKAFPFRNPDFALMWQGQEASVYAWERGMVSDAQAGKGIPRGSDVVPETLMRQPGENGPRLVKCLEGYEAQYWTNGFLKASRWWPTLPTSVDWARFERSSGLPALTPDSCPSPVELAMLERPWTEGAFSISDWSSLLKSRNVVAALATAAICPFIFFGVQYAVLSAAEARARAELADLDSKNKSVRVDRSEAYANLEAIEDYLRLDEFPPQAEVLTKAITMLAQSGAPKILSWGFDRGNLELILRSGPNLDATAYITLFERDDYFENVSGTLTGQERDLQLRMTLTSKPRQ